MEHYKQLYYFGNCYTIHYRNGGSSSMIMTNVWQIRPLTANNVQSYGTWITIKFHMSTKRS